MKQQFQIGDSVITPEGRGFISGNPSEIGEWPVELFVGKRWYFEEDLTIQEPGPGLRTGQGEE
jgi:hypothetical protein